MIKTYISTLLVMLLAGAYAAQAQENMDDVFAQLEAANNADGTVVEAEVADAAEKSGMSDESVLNALYKKGQEYYRAGDYASAQVVFQAMLSIDKYNNRAITQLKRTAKRIEAHEASMTVATRAEAIADVTKAWNTDYKVSVTPDIAGVEPEADPDAAAIEQMEGRLKSIMIPSLDFRDANINDVVLFLTETSRRLDAQGKGINILLLGMDDSSLADESSITISIRDMSLFEALQYVVEMASLKFEVKPSVVAISPVNYVAEEDMVMMSYDVMSEVGSELESASDSDGGGADDLFGDSSASSGATGPVDVVPFFSIVDFPEGSSAIYQPRFHKLFVKNTPKNLTQVESVLADLEDEAIKKQSQQVEIEAKFVEFNEGALEELGFDWTLHDDGDFADFSLKDGTYYEPGSGPLVSTTLPDGSELYGANVDGLRQIEPNPGPGQSLMGSSKRTNTSAFDAVQSGILSTLGGAPAAMVFENTGSFPIDLRITAMEQEGTADVLSAPKVTTKSGTEAIIRVVEEHRYPQDWDVETGQRTAPVVKPQDWENVYLGVVLKVEPVVNPDTDTIDLRLEPEITKFKGYDDYVVGYNAYDSGASTTVVISGDGSTLYAKMPFFERRTIQTEVTIADGSTVLMGGLVDETTETFRDQVPFLGDIPYLGRFFRSEGTRTSKKNLVIYVQATMVDAHGMTSSDREAARQAMN